MRIVTLGDIHGKTIWKQIIDTNSFVYHNGKLISHPPDKIIFVGDYVDDYIYGNVHILDNLKNIIQYKRDNMDKVVLLLGNHDFQYLFWPDYRCQGFRPEAYPDLFEMFYKNRELFQIAWGYNNFIWTHAGINEIWRDKYMKGKDPKNIVEDLNEMTMTRPGREAIGHEIGSRGMFNSGYGSPIWSDMKETMRYPINGFHQVVGHTRVKEIKVHAVNENCSMTYVDCLYDEIDPNTGKQKENQALVLSL